MIELERTFLAKYLPEGLKECDSKKIIDLYVENETDHCDLRIRRSGDSYEITRKIPVDDSASKQIETTIPVNAEEFDSLATIRCKKVEKTRYYYDYEGTTAEFDVFENDLAGLVLVDFEFETESERDVFQMPEFCLADITPELFIAGGVIAGKIYADVKADLDRWEYKKLVL